MQWALRKEGIRWDIVVRRRAGWYDQPERGRSGRRRGRIGHVESLPGMQERGGAQTIGALEFGNRNPIGLTQTEKRIARLNVVNRPAVRCTAWQWRLGAHGRNVDHHPGKQLLRYETIGALQDGDINLIACGDAVQRFAGLHKINQPSQRRRTIGRRHGRGGSQGGGSGWKRRGRIQRGRG